MGAHDRIGARALREKVMSAEEAAALIPSSSLGNNKVWIDDPGRHGRPDPLR
jgi:hypothetical protein